MDQSAKSELLFISFLLLVFLAFGITATTIFIRQWRRENRKK
jgi:hypothetical protein